jgi:hypothetical protein
MLFHIVYGEDKEILMELIYASSQRIFSLTCNKMLNQTVEDIFKSSAPPSLQKLRALFFILLNIDIQLKEYVCDTSNRKLFSEALNTPPCDITSKKCYVLTGTRTGDAKKLSSFFIVLKNEIIPNWLQDQELTVSDLVNAIREQYIIC